MTETLALAVNGACGRMGQRVIALALLVPSPRNRLSGTVG